MSVTTLKRIALGAMVLNYIGAFIPGAPILFQWLGRLAAPLFFYCMAWGVEKTHDKKIYFIRLYICSVSMALINLILSVIVQKTGLITTVTSNMFATLFASAFFIEILEYGRKHPRKRTAMWLRYAFFQISVAVLWAMLYELIEVPYAVLNLFSAICGNALTCEGASLFVIMGAIFYYTKEDKRRLVICYSVLCLVFFLNSAFGIWGRIFMLLGAPLYEAGDVLVALMEIMTGLILWGASSQPLFDLYHMFHSDFQWMMIAALPILYFCSGKRGEGKKYFYYIFYPAHIYLLWLIGVVILG